MNLKKLCKVKDDTTPNWAPKSYIWFQRKGEVTAYVNRMGDAENNQDICQYNIYDEYGKLLKHGVEDTLAASKKAVFTYFETLK